MLAVHQPRPVDHRQRLVRAGPDHGGDQGVRGLTPDQRGDSEHPEFGGAENVDAAVDGSAHSE